jgi:glutaredoxin
MGRLSASCAIIIAAAALVSAQPPPAPSHLTVSLYFSPTCPHCHPVRALIKRINAQHPQVRSVEYNLAEPSNVEKMAAAYQQYRVPEEQWAGTIALLWETGGGMTGTRYSRSWDRLLMICSPVPDAGRSRK